MLTTPSRWNRDLSAPFAAILALLTSAIPANGGVSVPAPSSWRSNALCGANSAYVFLKLHGISALYPDVVSGIPADERGSALDDMRRYLSRHFDVAVVQATPHDLLELGEQELPVIAHLILETTAVVNSQDRGHFVVIIGADDEEVRYVDGTTAAIRTEKSDRFFRQWTGYLIVKGESWFDKFASWMRMALLPVALFAGIQIGGNVRRYVFAMRSREGRS
jgi:hypothetical protein